MPMKSDMKITGNQLKMTRVFNAPRQVVFGWWADAQKLQQWSGCKETIRCEIQMDFRVGGSFTQKMEIAGAGEFTFTGKYDEIIEPERIAYHADFGQFKTHITVEFIEQGDGTKVVLTQEGFPDEFYCKTVSQGTSESWDKLDLLLPEESRSLGA